MKIPSLDLTWIWHTMRTVNLCSNRRSRYKYQLGKELLPVNWTSVNQIDNTSLVYTTKNCERCICIFNHIAFAIFIINLQSWISQHFLSIYLCTDFSPDILQERPAPKKHLSFFNRFCSKEWMWIDLLRDALGLGFDF